MKRRVVAMRRRLNMQVFPLLEKWFTRASRGKDVRAACVISAHLALLLKNAAPEDIDCTAMTTLLASHVFLNHNFAWDVEKPTAVYERHTAFGGNSAALGTFAANQQQQQQQQRKKKRGSSSEEHELGIPQTQVFDLFQRHRRAILKRLRERPEECAEAMEAVTRVVTFTGTRQEGQNHLERRRWVELDPLRNAGRFVIQLDREEGAAAAPSASHEAGGEDAAAAAAAAPSALAGAAAPAETYDAWLAREELGATPCLERRALTAVP